jgi:hypothetical protein
MLAQLAYWWAPKASYSVVMSGLQFDADGRLLTKGGHHPWGALIAKGDGVLSGSLRLEVSARTFTRAGRAGA